MKSTRMLLHSRIFRTVNRCRCHARNWPNESGKANLVFAVLVREEKFRTKITVLGGPMRKLFLAAFASFFLVPTFVSHASAQKVMTPAVGAKPLTPFEQELVEQVK